MRNNVQASQRVHLLLALITLCAGCHRYEAARVGAVPEGTDVRIRLSDDGARRLESATGRRGDEITGRLLEWSDAIVLSVPLPPQPGVVDRDLRQRVSVPAGDVLRVDVRRPDRTRSVLLTATVATVAVVAVVAAVSGVFGGHDEPMPPGDEEGLTAPGWLRVFP